LSFFYRYLHDTFPIVSGSGTFGSGVAIPGLSTTITTNPGTQHMGHATYLFSPKMLANVGYAYSSNAVFTTPIGAFTTAASTDVSPTLPYQNVLGVIPTLSFGGSNAFANLGSTGIYHDIDKNNNVFGDLTRTIGRHTLIAGASYNHFEKAENAVGSSANGYNEGAFTFTGVNTNATGVSPTGNAATQTDLGFANFLEGNANGGFNQASNAITADILETSLGYFLLPLVNVALGRLVLRENLRRTQWIAVSLAATGVLFQIVQLGRLPWIALTLAVTFSTYGLLRKRSSLGPLTGLTLETALLTPVALAYLWWCYHDGTGALGRVDDHRSMQWFAPRRPRSTWALTNKERVARLEAAGLMAEAGRETVEVARANGSWESMDAIDSLVVPDDLAAALAERPGAREHFDASSASVRRSALAWVYQAKRPETRAAHVAQVAAIAGRGEPISNLWRRD